MTEYIKTLIPRIKQFSQSLDTVERFVDIPWVIIDNENRQHKYIFKRNGELIMSLSGSVISGRWELIASAMSLLIDRGTDKILLNHDFVDQTLLLLRIDGTQDNVILVNQNLLPSLDYGSHLRKIYYEKNNIRVFETEQSYYLECQQDYYNLQGSRVTIDAKPAPDGKFCLKNDERKIIIHDGKIEQILIDVKYSTDKGLVIVEEDYLGGIFNGSQVQINGESAPSGKYHLELFKAIKVRDGQVIRLSIF